LERRRTKAEHTAKAIRRIKVTAARPWLGTGSRAPVRIVAPGTVAAGVQEAVPQGPVLGKVHPAVVLVFPAVVPQAADHGGGWKLGRRKTKAWKRARKTLAGEMSGLVRASDIWRACRRSSKPLR
jgi:hypothetical protein